MKLKNRVIFVLFFLIHVIFCSDSSVQGLRTSGTHSASTSNFAQNIALGNGQLPEIQALESKFSNVSFARQVQVLLGLHPSDLERNGLYWINVVKEGWSTTDDFCKAIYGNPLEGYGEPEKNE